MIYGTPQFKRETDSTDRVGIRTVIWSKLWQASRWPMTDAELNEEKPAPPATPGGILIVGDETRPIGGGLRTYWTYEGINGDGRTVTFKDRGKSLDYGFTGGFEQTDIRKHPKIQALMEKYGGILDPSSLDIVWPLTVPEEAAGGLRKNAEQGKRNPMFGRNEFLQCTGAYTFRYVSFNKPSSAGVNKIRKSGGLPGDAPSYPGTDWLMAPPIFKRRGPVFDITEIYLLSGPGGWPEPIHNLTDSGGGGNEGNRPGGLTTGSL